MGSYNVGTSSLKKKSDHNFWTLWKRYQFTYWLKKSNFEGKLESKCNFSNIYDVSANFRDSPKVWQMKLRLWHGILPENGKCLLGTKKSKIMPNVGIDYFLSFPFTFPVVVNVKPCQIYTENNQISIFNFFPPKFGALPILQECPRTSSVLQT